MTFCEPGLKGNGAKQIVLRPDLVALLSPPELLGAAQGRGGQQSDPAGVGSGTDSSALLSTSCSGGSWRNKRTDPGLLSAAELLFSGWQPATCRAAILILSWSSSDK